MPLLSETRTYFSVAYEDREEVKKMGGMWDKDKKRWYVEKWMDLIPFIRKWDLLEPTKYLKVSGMSIEKTEGDENSGSLERRCVYAQDLYDLWNNKYISTRCYSLTENK